MANLSSSNFSAFHSTNRNFIAGSTNDDKDVFWFGSYHLKEQTKVRRDFRLLNAAFALFHNMPYNRVLYLSISLHFPIVIVLMVQHKDFGDQKNIVLPLSKIMMCKSFSSDHFTILFTIAKGVKKVAQV